MEQETFCKELMNLLGNKYIIHNGVGRCEDTGADICIIAEFNCNVYDKKNGWVNCHTCHCHYGCHISNTFTELLEKYNYEMEWEECCVAGLYKLKTK